MIITVDTQAKALASMTALGGAFDKYNMYVGVYSSINNRGQHTTMADVVQCTGHLANRFNLNNALGPYQQTDNSMVSVTALLGWETFDPTEVQSVGGWFFSDSVSAGQLLAFGPINPPYFVRYPYGAIHLLTILKLLPSAFTDASRVYHG